MFDYINGITIGSIAAEMATEIDKSIWVGIVAMGVYAVISYGISYFTSKSVGVRKIVTGRTILLYDNRTFFRNNMDKARLDISDLFTFMRGEGFFNMGDIQTIILEHNGNISILPVSTKRPATPSDFGIKIPNESLYANVIMDGKMMSKNLKVIDKTEEWLINEITAQGYKKVEDIFLATVDNENNVSIYTSTDSKKNPDIFE